MIKLTRHETETIIRRSEDDKYWDIYSDVPRDIRRILAMAEAFGCETHTTPFGGVRCLVPVAALTFRKYRGGAGHLDSLIKLRERDDETLEG
jgi:hypothetical protein